MESDRERAERILSGQTVPAVPPSYPLLSNPDFVVVEMKLCEHCPRNFARVRGTDERLCPRCRELALPVGKVMTSDDVRKENMIKPLGYTERRKHINGGHHNGPRKDVQ